MEIVYSRCCGLDIHKRLVVACRIVPGSDGQPCKEIRTFGTMTEDLLQLGDWLAAEQVTHGAMEATGIYWHPIYNLLEDQFTLLLANAQHIKAVPGRKTDVKDCEWIADLLRHGLLRPSFVPDRPQRELRELTRYRTTLIQARSAEVNRLQKTLEGANSKLAAVASSVVGKSAREMLDALVGGRRIPRRWPNWRGGASGRSSRNWSWRSGDTSPRTHSSSSPNIWRISTIWMKPSSA